VTVSRQAYASANGTWIPGGAIERLLLVTTELEMS
jgi:hypothetical protein